MQCLFRSRKWLPFFTWWCFGATFPNTSHTTRSRIGIKLPRRAETLSCRRPEPPTSIPWRSFLHENAAYSERLARGVTQQTLRTDVGEGHGRDSWSDEIKTSDFTARLVDIVDGKRLGKPTIKDETRQSGSTARQTGRFLWRTVILMQLFGRLCRVLFYRYGFGLKWQLSEHGYVRIQNAFHTHELQC